MALEVKQWLEQKFPNDKNDKLANFLLELYPNAQTVEAIEQIVDDADAKLKAYYLIGLSAETVKNTNLRSNTLGKSLQLFSMEDFEGKTKLVQEIAQFNSIDGWPNPTNLFASKDIFTKTKEIGALKNASPYPKSVYGKLGVAYGLDTNNIEQNIYRFAFLNQSLTLQKSKRNRQAINELLYLTKKGETLPEKVRKILIKEFENVQGNFEKGKPIIIDTKLMQKEETKKENEEEIVVQDVAKSIVKDTNEMKPAALESDVDDSQLREKSMLLKDQTQKLMLKASETRKQLATMQAESRAKKTFEKIALRFETLAQLAEDCFKVFTEKPNISQQQFNSCTQTFTQIEAEAMLLEESKLVMFQLVEREQKLRNTEIELQQCKREREAQQNQTTEKQNQLERQIKEMEKTRIETQNEIQNLKNERADIQKKLASLVLKLEKISAVKKNCSAIGKTIQEALGSTEAKKFDSIQSKTLSETKQLQELLLDISSKVDELTLVFNGAQQTECSLQEQLMKLQQENDEGRQREMKLDEKILEERVKVSELQKKVRQLEEASKKTSLSTDIVEKLQKDLEKCSKDKKIGLNKFSELEVLAQDLLQQTKTVTEKAQKCETFTKETQKKYAEQQQQAQEEQKSLREALQSCEARSVSNLNQKTLIQEQQQQLEELKKEKARMQKDLAKCTKILTSLKDEQSVQQNLLIKAQEENELQHKMFLDNIVSGIINLQTDKNEKQLANQINQYAKEDRDYIVNALEKIRKEKKSLPGISSPVVRTNIVESTVKELEKKVYEMKLAEADAVAKYDLLKNQLDAAQMALENCKNQSKDDNSKENLQSAEKKCNECTQNLESNRLKLEEMKNELQNLESLKVFAEEELKKCNADKEELINTYEKSDLQVEQQISQLKTENKELTQKLEELSGSNPELLPKLQQEVQSLRDEINTLKNRETELEQNAKSLIADNSQSEQKKQEIVKQFENQKKLLQETKDQLVSCQNSMESANKEIFKMIQLKEQLLQCQNQSNNKIQNSIETLENKISNLTAEKNSLREQSESFQRAFAQSEEEKRKLEQLLNLEKQENQKLTKQFKAAVDLLEKLKVEDEA